MPIFIVERVFSPPITEAQFAASGAALHPCIEERDVTGIRSYFSPDGTRAICVFEAADAERVREANRSAGMPFERVWQAKKYE
jgi:hypothetical protein